MRLSLGRRLSRRRIARSLHSGQLDAAVGRGGRPQRPVRARECTDRDAEAARGRVRRPAAQREVPRHGQVRVHDNRVVALRRGDHRPRQRKHNVARSQKDTRVLKRRRRPGRGRRGVSRRGHAEELQRKRRGAVSVSHVLRHGKRQVLQEVRPGAAHGVGLGEEERHGLVAV